MKTCRAQRRVKMIAKAAIRFNGRRRKRNAALCAAGSDEGSEGGEGSGFLSIFDVLMARVLLSQMRLRVSGGSPSMKSP